MVAVAGSMKRAGGGSIVNLSSTAGLIGVPGIMSYVAAKWAVRGMTKAAAQELAVDGIRVNSVHPGVIDTAMNADRAADPMVAQQPIKRYGSPEEVARMVAFLASEEASYSTGAEFIVDGATPRFSAVQLAEMPECEPECFMRLVVRSGTFKGEACKSRAGSQPVLVC